MISNLHWWVFIYFSDIFQSVFHYWSCTKVELILHFLLRLCRNYICTCSEATQKAIFAALPQNRDGKIVVLYSNWSKSFLFYVLLRPNFVISYHKFKNSPWNFAGSTRQRFVQSQFWPQRQFFSLFFRQKKQCQTTITKFTEFWLLRRHQQRYCRQ